MQYEPGCFDCRKDAGKELAGLTDKSLCLGHLWKRYADAQAEIERLKAESRRYKESLQAEMKRRCQCEFDGSECYSECKYHGKMAQEIAALREKLRVAENDVVQTSAIYEAISDIIRAGGTSDFMLSFPIVSKVLDLRERACCMPSNEWGHTKDCIREKLRVREEALREIASGNRTAHECMNWARQAIAGKEEHGQES